MGYQQSIHEEYIVYNHLRSTRCAQCPLMMMYVYVNCRDASQRARNNFGRVLFGLLGPGCELSKENEHMKNRAIGYLVNRAIGTWYFYFFICRVFWFCREVCGSFRAQPLFACHNRFSPILISSGAPSREGKRPFIIGTTSGAGVAHD